MRLDDKTIEDARNIMYTYELQNLNDAEEILDWVVKLIEYDKFTVKQIELAERPFGSDADASVFDVAPNVDKTTLLDACVNNCANRITIMGKFGDNLALFIIELNNAKIKATIRKIMLEEYRDIEKELNLV